MDFEFNKESPDSGACPHVASVLRTIGDFLIEYSIDPGGAQANVTLREWTGSAWGEPTDISEAVGTIDQTAIPAGESEPGALSPRTFGEASIDLNVLFDEGSCESFGSAMLKSRSSDSFTSQLKNFIAPVSTRPATTPSRCTTTACRTTRTPFCSGPATPS